MAQQKKRHVVKYHPKKLVRAPQSILPHVSFLKTTQFEHVDARRFISGVAGDFGFPLQIKQIKVIEFSEEAVKQKQVVGNHRHFGESGQWEVIVVLGGGTKPLFRFRYRNFVGGVHEKKMKGGDIALIPPGCSLALMALRPGAKVIEISNQEYRNMNYMDDPLF